MKKNKKYPIEESEKSSVHDVDYGVEEYTKKHQSSKKIFKETKQNKDFPKDCVTIDTFFSDLEDYIRQKNEDL